MKTITLHLTPDQLHAVTEGLMHVPFGKAAPVIAAIQEQTRQPAPEVPSPPTPPPAAPQAAQSAPTNGAAPLQDLPPPPQPPQPPPEEKPA